MRKLMLLTVVSVFGWTFHAYALPVGGWSMLSQEEEHNFTGGYEGSFVFERELDTRNAEIDELNDSFAKFSYIPGEYPVELYGLLGVMRFEVDQGSAHYDTDYGFAYGFGGKTVLWQSEQNTAIGLDAKYRRSEPEIDESTFSNRGEATYQDWQVALGVSQEIKENITPYGGIKYNDVSITDVAGFADQNSEDVIGLFAGLEVKASENLALNVEGSFVNESAITGGVAWHF